MLGQFDEHGIRFRYPKAWQIEREETGSGWSVHVQSPGSAFLLITIDEDMPSPEDMLETTLQALRSEYPDVETQERVETLAGSPAVGHDVQFTSLDLTNTCRTRSFYTENATALLLWQATDLDLDEVGPVMQAICSSLEIEA